MSLQKEKTQKSTKTERVRYQDYWQTKHAQVCYQVNYIKFQERLESGGTRALL